MKIAYIHPPFETLPPIGQHRARGSLMVWTNEIARRLAQQHEIVVYSAGDKELDGTIHDQGIEYRYVNSRTHRFERKFVNLLAGMEAVTNYPRRKRPIFATRWFYPHYIQTIAREMTHEDWDIVHITNFAQFAPVLRSYLPDSRIVIHKHDLWLSQFDPRLVRQYINAADLVITVSDFVTNALAKAIPEYAQRYCTLHNGVEIDTFFLERDDQQPTDDAPQILFVGRVSPEKGVHVLIDAFKQIAARYPKAELNIVGELFSIGYFYIIPMADDPIVRDLARFYHPLIKRDRYQERLQAMIPPSLQDRIHFRGSISHDDVRDYLRRASVFVFPSVWDEPFSIALIEGQASGVPVVATRSGGSTELLVDGETGFLVERNNPDELARTIEDLIANPELGQRLGHAAQARIQNVFSWDQCAQQLEDYYDALVGNLPSAQR